MRRKRGEPNIDLRHFNKGQSIFTEYEEMIKQVLKESENVLTTHAIFKILRKKRRGLNIWKGEKREICYETLKNTLDRLSAEREVLKGDKQLRPIKEKTPFQRIYYQLPDFEPPGQKIQRLTAEFYRRAFLKKKKQEKYPMSVVMTRLSDEDQKNLNRFRKQI